MKTEKQIDRFLKRIYRIEEEKNRTREQEKIVINNPLILITYDDFSKIMQQERAKKRQIKKKKPKAHKEISVEELIKQGRIKDDADIVEALIKLFNS